MTGQGRQGSIIRIVGPRYRTAGRLRVRTGKGQNQEDEKNRDWEKQRLRDKCWLTWQIR